MAQRLPTMPGKCDQPRNGRSRQLDSKGPSPVTSDQNTTQTSITQANPDGAESPTNENDTPEELYECAICLQTCIHPVKLPCSHIFCFLCVKGVAIQSKRCALCRQDIPVDYFNNPSLLRKEDLLKECAFEGGYQWYYQGINGWWQYDERASSEIEKYFNEGSSRQMEILIAGFLYIIDFDNMLQFRRNDPSRRRKIKRDLMTIPDKKGVAGLKVVNRSPDVTSPVRPQGDGGENVPCVVQQGASRGNASQQTRQTNQQTVTVPGSLSNPPSPQVPHNTPEERSQQDCPEPTGDELCPTVQSRNRQLPSSRATRRQQPQIPEQPASNTDNLSSQFMNLALEETPRARSSHRNRPRHQPTNKKSTRQLPDNGGNQE